MNKNMYISYWKFNINEAIIIIIINAYSLILIDKKHFIDTMQREHVSSCPFSIYKNRF